jgi:hypothetical protein
MERIEQRRTVEITKAETLRVYYALTQRLYGGGDTGAYETDALDNWRNPDLTFRDTKGNPYTIDAYLRLNPSNHDEMRAALALSGPKGIAVCLNLPAAYSSIMPPETWQVPEGGALVGPWMPGSWGGHSLWLSGYVPEGGRMDHTWECERNLVTWEALSAYCDEAHMVIDSLDHWRVKVKESTVGKLNLTDVRDAVNEVSSIRIE